MTTDLDELPVPHFEDRLWQELARVHAAARSDTSHAGPRGPAGAGHVRRVRRGRRFVLLGVGSLAAAAALVAAVVVVGSDGDGTDTGGHGPSGRDGSADPADPAGPSPSGEEAPAVDLAAEISEATDEAAADSVVHVVQDFRTAPGDSEMWSDETSGALRILQLGETGAPIFDSGWPAPPAPDQQAPEIPEGVPPIDPSVPRAIQRQVDYCFRQYVDNEMPALPARNEGEMIAEWLANGELIEDGTEVVDGRELIRLVRTLGSIQPPDTAPGEPSPTSTVVEGEGEGSPSDQGAPSREEVEDLVEPAAPPPTPGDDEDLVEPAAPAPSDDEVLSVYLVDPETYRPVRMTGYPGSDTEYVMTFEYLPRTPENLALLSPPVPEGFTQVDVLRGDGERYDAGCL